MLVRRPNDVIKPCTWEISDNLGTQRCNQGQYMKKLKKSTLLLITALLIVTVAIIGIATAPYRNKTKAFLNGYEITDLTALGFTRVAAINDKGQVLGTDKQNRICIWDKQGGLTVLNVPKEAANRLVDAFNNSGQIAGSFQTANGQSHAYIWDANNGLVDLGTLGGKTSRVLAMNDSGQVIGSSRDPSGWPYSFFWDTDTGMLNLSGGTNDPEPYFWACGLNNAGTVVGYTPRRRGFSAAAWDRDKRLVRLFTPRGYPSKAYSISSSGLIAGAFTTSRKQSHLIVWDDPNNFRDLGPIGRNTDLVPRVINDAGQIIGVAIQQGIWHHRRFSFFFSDETGFVDLGDFPRYDPTPFRRQLPWLFHSTSTSAPCVPQMNNSGQILNCARTKDGQYHAILMTPKKDPKE